jgi:hypothetical protein
VQNPVLRKAKLTNLERTQYDALGKLLGRRVEFVDSVGGGMANASIDFNTNTIKLALDGVDRFETSLMHEAVHSIKESSPSLYNEFENWVINRYDGIKAGAHGLAEGETGANRLDALLRQTLMSTAPRWAISSPTPRYPKSLSLACSAR